MLQCFNNKTGALIWKVFPHRYQDRYSQLHFVVHLKLSMNGEFMNSECTQYNVVIIIIPVIIL